MKITVYINKGQNPSQIVNTIRQTVESKTGMPCIVKVR
jgi:hypothetical protein